MSALPNYKDIVDLLKKGATFEAQEKILELREAAMSLQEENLQLRSQMSKLQSEVATAKSLRFDRGLYWLEEPAGQRDGPFCPICKDNDSKMVRLHDGRKRDLLSRWCCLVCHFGSEDNS